MAAPLLLLRNLGTVLSLLIIGGMLLVGFALIAIGTGIVEDVIRQLLRDMAGF